jgi:CRP-like cAMP-binding protein
MLEQRKNSMEGLINQERQVNQYIDQGQKELAVKFLYDLIIDYAKAKDFAVAENLRERLIQIDNMALSEIVNSAEIIEAEKSVTIDEQQRGLWKQLYDSLTPEESNAFYLAAKQKTFAPNRTIIKQEMLSDKLFFIKEGRLKLLYQQDEKEIYLKQINKGEIVGQDTFFSISICTISVITMSRVELSYIDLSALQKLEEQFPGFENKLQEFCLKSGDKIEDILKRKQVERRRYARFKVSGEIATLILDDKNKPVAGPFRGHLKDISAGGVCYFIKCSKKSSARRLLGRSAQFQMSFPKDGGHMTVKTKGLIVAVHYCFFNDYSVHVRFSKLVPEDQIRQLGVAS